MHFARLVALHSLLAVALVATPTARAARNDTSGSAVEALERALIEHDFGLLEDRLDSGFSYAGHEGEMARTIMRQVVAGFPEGLTRIEVLGSRVDAGIRLVDVRLHGLESGELRTIELSPDGAIRKAEVAEIQLAGHGSLPDADQGSGAAPETSWSLTLEGETGTAPFELRDEFPVPLVQVQIGGQGPFLFAIDTAAGTTALLRLSLAETLGLSKAGKAFIGDGSGRHRQSVDLVRIPELRFGDVVARDLVAVTNTPSADHAATIPDDAMGILGRELFRDVLWTIDYPGRRLVLRKGILEDDAAAVPFDFVGGVMELSIDIAGRPTRLFLDSGHQRTISLPRSQASKLPLAAPLVEAGWSATVVARYTLQSAPLAGAVTLGGHVIEGPTLYFADEPTPSLIGGGVLRDFAVTIDQRSRLVRFENTAPDRSSQGS